MKNFIQEGEFLSVACSSPAVPASGDPVRFGNMTGVAVTTEAEGGNAAGETTVRFGGGVYSLSVTDVATGGIAVGASLYLHDGSPPTITNVSASGYFFGFALEIVLTGATTTIKVLHVASPGAGTLGAGTVGSTNLAANAVQTSHITADNVTTAKIANVVGKFSVSPKGTVVANAATGNVLAADVGKIETNTGAGAGIVLTLPAASTVPLGSYKFQLTAAQPVTLTPQTGEKVYLGGSGVASKYALIAGVIGNFADLYCDGTDYSIVNYSGVVTKEA